jgi:hypothetical protein
MGRKELQIQRHEALCNALINGGEMRTGLTAGGGMVLGMIIGIIFDSLGRGDEHRGMVLGMVFGLVFGGVVAGLRRSRSSRSN